MGDKERAAYFLNIAGRGGAGVGQYGIALFTLPGPATTKDRKYGFLNDYFRLSDELIAMLESKAWNGDGDAACRLGEHFKFTDAYAREGEGYYLLAAEYGNARALADLKRKGHSDEGLAYVYERNPLKQMRKKEGAK